MQIRYPHILYFFRWDSLIVEYASLRRKNIVFRDTFNLCVRDPKPTERNLAGSLGMAFFGLLGPHTPIDSEMAIPQRPRMLCDRNKTVKETSLSNLSGVLLLLHRLLHPPGQPICLHVNAKPG